MRVALETNGIYTTQAGVARYIRGLMRGFEQAAIRDFEFVQITWPVENLAYRQPIRAIKTAYRELWWAWAVAPFLIKRGRFDLFHSTTFGIVDPPACVPEVATLHDVALLRHPERFRSWQRWSGKRRFDHLRKVEKVIAVSRFSADEAIKLLGLNPKKIEVIYHGCDFLDANSSEQATQPDFLVPSEFFLFVGSLEPGKNLPLLKDVYQAARAKGRVLPPLLIIGARWQGVQNEGPPPEGWHYLGRQPDEILRYLYPRALALLFPSKYEGFGLPVIEAMSMKCPVVCSPVASLPEVAGDAALMSEQTPHDYLDAMTRILSEQGLRENLIQKGVLRASKFTWKRCAQETGDAYRRSLGAG
jgi:alpha-1,3-rhamnosyl/mannosyltransferase